jgi:antitoxin (DNA-binding transcriptional repressor) of toxin-antitoxin stability system
MNATIVDLRYRMKEVLRAIDRGETVSVLYRGKERAKLVPIGRETDPMVVKTEDQPLFGIWKDRDDMSDPDSYVRQLRQPRQVQAAGEVKRSARERKAR